MPMHQNFQVLVQEHPTWHRDHHHQERRPPAFENEKQSRDAKNDPDPFAGAEFSDSAQHTHECGRQVSVKPESHAVIDSGERIRYS